MGPQEQVSARRALQRYPHPVAPEEVLAILVDLARAGGLELRNVAGLGSSGAELSTHSGVCRVRDGIYVILVASDPVEDRIEALAGALREHRPEAYEGRYLPPAVRSRLDGTA